MPTGKAHEKTSVGALRGTKTAASDPTGIRVSLEEGEPVYLTLQQARANFTRVCNGKRAVLVGNRYHARAIIIPMGPDRWLDHEKTKARDTRIKTNFEEALEMLL